jgi:parvulin-like peptidyl-prolyl isomerase
VVEQLTRSLGSKGELESYLSQFGVDIKNLRAYYTLYFKSEAIKASFTATEEEKEAYFADNYSIVKHILINTTFKVKDDGSKVSQTEEERAVQLARAEALSARLSAGEDFDELWAMPEYQDADAAGAAKYPEGYFVRENSQFTPEFEAAALDMKDGEIRTVNGTYGIHIMKKYPMDSKKYNLYSDVDKELSSAVASANYEKAVAPYAEKVVVDEELLSAYSMASAPTMLQ